MNLTQSQQETWDVFQKVKKEMLSENKKSIAPSWDFTNQAWATWGFNSDEVYEEDKINGYTFSALFKAIKQGVSTKYEEILEPILTPLAYELDGIMLGDKLQNIYNMDDVNWKPLLNSLEQELLKTFNNGGN